MTDLLVEHFGEYVDLAFTAGMEEELDEIARGEREWVPLLREFYGPLKELVDEKRRGLRRRDFTTEPSDEVCSLGHPMVIRLGRNGRFLACSLYPEHKESRPLPGEEEPRPWPASGEPCPKCGETDGGVLVARRGRFGPFVGCSRYPDCDYIKKDGPPPPEPLPFEVVCPKCGDGQLTPVAHGGPARRSGAARATRSATSRRSHEPLGADSTTPTPGRSPGRATTRRSASSAARRSTCPRQRSCRAPASRAARLTRRRWPGPSRGGRGGARGAAGGARSGTRTGRSRAGRSPTGRRAAVEAAGASARPGRDRRRRPSSGSSAGSPPVTPPSTRGGPTRPRSVPISTGSTDEASTGGARRGTISGPISRCSARAEPGARSRRGSAALRSFYTLAARQGCAPATRGARSRLRASATAAPASSRSARSRHSSRRSTMRPPQQPPERAVPRP